MTRTDRFLANCLKHLLFVISFVCNYNFILFINQGCLQKYCHSILLSTNRQVTLSYLLNTSTMVHQSGPSALKKIWSLVKNKHLKLKKKKKKSPPPLLFQRTSHPIGNVPWIERSEWKMVLRPQCNCTIEFFAKTEFLYITFKVICTSSQLRDFSHL